MSTIPGPEFSRVVHLDESQGEEITARFDATCEERELLARRFGVIAIERMSAQVALYRKPSRPFWHLDGHVLAEVVQRCVVTLDPLSRTYAFDFKRTYAPCPEEAVRADDEGSFDEVLSLDQNDPPEPLFENVIDVGEAIAEELGLALDPFPKAPGVVFNGYSVGPGEEETHRSPFAALAEGRRSSGTGEKS